MRLLDRNSAAALLRSQGLTDDTAIANVLDGFDFTKPVYERQFWPGEFVQQLIRLPSATDPAPRTGNWFGLSGITTSGVAINDGLSGRRGARFEVVAPFVALEGSASPKRVDLGTAIGGRGGQTQIYMPNALIGRLRGAGAVDRA